MPYFSVISNPKNPYGPPPSAGMPLRFVIPTVVLLLSFTLLVLGVVFRVSAFNTLKAINKEYSYYQDMIAEAVRLDYIVEGTVTDVRPGYGGKYYIVYEIPKTSGAGTLEGASFSVYSESEAHYMLDTKIDIATNTKKITSTTDSVPMDYRGTPLNQNGKYNVNVRKKDEGTILIALSAIFASVGAVLLICIMKKTLKEIKELRVPKGRQLLAIMNKNSKEKKK